jgi:hypothetical protein
VPAKQKVMVCDGKVTKDMAFAQTIPIGCDKETDKSVCLQSTTLDSNKIWAWVSSAKTAHPSGYSQAYDCRCSYNWRTARYDDCATCWRWIDTTTYTCAATCAPVTNPRENCQWREAP